MYKLKYEYDQNIYINNTEVEKKRNKIFRFMLVVVIYRNTAVLKYCK